jgi:O-antigen ligase
MPEEEPARERPSRAVRLLAGAVLLGPVAIAFFSGGFFDEPRLVLALLTWLLLAVAALLGIVSWPRSTGGRLMLLGLALLTAVTVASVAWSPLSGRALDDGQRTLLYLGYLLLAAAALRPRATARWAEPAVAGGAAVVMGYALASRLVPGVYEPREGYHAAGRLDQPLTYWNALGAVAALGLVLCARLAGDPQRPRWMRVAAGAAAAPLGAGLYLTFSRGSILFALVGLVALIAFLPRRVTLLAAGVVTLAGTVGAVAVAVLPGVADPVDATTAVQGGTAIAVLGLLALVGGAAASRLRGDAAAPEERPGLARVALAAIAVGLTTILVLLLAGVSGVGTEKVDVPTGPRAERLRSVDSERYDYWNVAVDAFASRPIAGLGAGGFGPDWLRERPADSLIVNDAHSIYVETAAELGLLGLLGLAALVVGVVLAGRRALRSDRVLAAGPAAVLLAWGVHAGLDWDWEMPAVTLPAVVLAAVLMSAADREPRPGAAPVAR